MGIQPMVFCALLGCLISLLVIPLILLPGLMRSIKACRFQKSAEPQTSFPENGAGCSLGGVALATSFLGVATLIYFLYPGAWVSVGQSNVAVVWTALAIFFLGLWDDFRPLRLDWKLMLQTAIAVVAYCQGVHFEAFTGQTNSAEFQPNLGSGAITVLWLVGLTNLIDLTRRVEGLTAAIGLVLLGFRAVTGFGAGEEFSALFSIGIAGALIGFLVYNLPPTRIRLGGAGAGFVGFLVATLTTVNSDHESSLSASAIVAVFVLPIFALVWLEARQRDKTSPLVPLDPKHVHRRLARADETRTQG